MTTYSAWQRTIVDGAGNALPGASIEVRREDSNTLAVLKADRLGASGATNPFVADGNGFARFYLAAGSYKITATSGAFSQIWRHVAAGTAQELDATNLSGLAGMRYVHTHASTNPPSPGSITSNNSIMSSSTSAIYFARMDANANDQYGRLLSFDDSTSIVKGLLVFRSMTGSVEMVFSISALTDYVDASPSLASVGFTVAFVSGEPSGDVFEDGSELLVEFWRTGDKGDQGIQGVQGNPSTVPGPQGPAGGFTGVDRYVTGNASLAFADSGKSISCESANSPPTNITLTFDPAENLGTSWVVLIKNIGTPTVLLVADTSSPPSNLINGEGAVGVMPNEWAFVWSTGSELRAAIMRIEKPDPDILKRNVSTTLTVGYPTTSFNNGTKSSGTFTPDVANGSIQHAVNGGAHTLAPPAEPCSMVIEYVNSSAGALTTSGFTFVNGDTYSTTGTKKHIFDIRKTNTVSQLHVTYVVGT